MEALMCGFWLNGPMFVALSSTVSGASILTWVIDFGGRICPHISTHPTDMGEPHVNVYCLGFWWNCCDFLPLSPLFFMKDLLQFLQEDSSVQKANALQALPTEGSFIEYATTVLLSYLRNLRFFYVVSSTFSTCKRLLPRASNGGPWYKIS